METTPKRIGMNFPNDSRNNPPFMGLLTGGRMTAAGKFWVGYMACMLTLILYIVWWAVN